MRFGISTMDGIFPKSLRVRRPSAAGAAAPEAVPGTAPTGAAAETPHFSCSSLESCAASSSVSLSSCSAICPTVSIGHSSLGLRSLLSSALSALLQDVDRLAWRRRQQAHQLSQGGLDGAHQLGPQRLPRRNVGEGPDVSRPQELPLQVAELDLGQGVRLDESLKSLGQGDGILLGDHEPRRTLQVRPEPVQRGPPERPPGPPGLAPLVLRRPPPELLSEIREL